MVAAVRRPRRPPLGVGVVGCGRISGVYLENLRAMRAARAVACADLHPARAAAAAAAHGVRALPVDDLLADPAVDIVLNLTVPAEHAAVSRAALRAGKHVYSEKPLAADAGEGRELLALARRLGLLVGCAPDTFLAGAWDTARELIAAGAIGRPAGASAAMHTAGPELWHPDPAFFYRRGGGPLFDMGPYYLTALVHLLGPVERVVAAAGRARTTRTIGSGARAGTEFAVEVDTHVSGVLVHTGGAITTLTTSFEVVASTQPRIEIHGTEGSLSVPDPNRFDGDVALRPRGADGWTVLAPSAGDVGAARGIGVLDLAVNHAAGRPHRASAEVAVHVLDVMETLLAAAHQRSGLQVSTSCERPAPVPLDAVADGESARLTGASS